MWVFVCCMWSFWRQGICLYMPLGQLLLFDGSITLVEIGQNFLATRKNL